MDKRKVEAMREGGKIMAQIFSELRDYTQAGLTGKEIDAFSWLFSSGRDGRS